MKFCVYIIGFILIFVAGAVTFTASADVYVYTDPQGNIHFTNAPSHKYFKPLIRSGASHNRSKVYTTPGKKRNSNGFKHRGSVSVSKISKEISKYMPIIKEAALKYKIPVSLIKAIIYAESAWDKNAVSSAGAQGLMQLMPATAKDLGVKDSFNPRQNIMGGVLYLRRLANMFNGDVVLMVSGYNAGHNRVMRLQKVPDIPETIDYTRKVLKMYRRFKKEKTQNS